MTTAPVCHISPDEAIASRGRVRFPSIPPAVDLTTALLAIKALTAIIIQLTGQQTLQGVPGIVGARGAGGVSGAGGSPGGPGKDGKPGKEGNWVEVDRQTQKKKITNPDDDSQFVYIQQITQLQMKDTVTGNTWLWKL